METPTPDEPGDVLDMVFPGSYEILTPFQAARYVDRAFRVGEGDSDAHTHIEGGSPYYGRFTEQVHEQNDSAQPDQIAS